MINAELSFVRADSEGKVHNNHPILPLSLPRKTSLIFIFFSVDASVKFK